MKRRRRVLNWWDGLSTYERDTYSTRAILLSLLALLVYVFWGDLTGEGR